ncbi:MAG: RHH-type transcriptional regulator, rel operon repressor / antitoxin RelB [Candidatus Argoarchaeum ethanivorans]|uniref:RHH-type transcriptional regulator, rel operon repressor / antitoxin RelB n=1 Tax=Candidatus Argoarchaeum ethanivorans TaxID=2608793 RepID=A0A8B3S4A3_9EURY|nr:MAG: RHH-type transcriptional regulator, rel operon repressor / antitoxin RelB [Candidatus Argoarchaeum ethanivorans]
MSVAVSIRLPEKIIHDLEILASTIERSKTFIIRKAIESYLEDYADYLVALERLRDKDDEIISGEELRGQLGL